MDERSAGRLAWLAFGLIVALVLAGLALSFLARVVADEAQGLWGFLLLVPLLTFPVVGVLIASRQPRNTIGWLFLAIGLPWGLATFLDSYAAYGLARPGAVPAPEVAAVLGGNVMWVPGIGLAGTFLILLFPDGRPPSPRWRPLAWLSGFALSLTAVLFVVAPSSVEFEGVAVANPLAIDALTGIVDSLWLVIVLIPICIVGCAASMVQRYRRSRGVERLQLKWLTAAVAVVATVYLLTFVLTMGGDAALWARVLQNTAVASFGLIPAAAGVAILRNRLFDIDVVIKKTVVFGTLAGFITVVYVAIVVGVGNLIGSSDDPNLGLSVLATALVAVAFQPVRERLEHVANRVVYGARATPYEVLSDFSDRVAEAYATEEVLPRMARAIREGVGAERAEVWLRAGAHLRPAASSPATDSADSRLLLVADGSLPPFEEADRAVEVRHQGELLGALTVSKPPADPLTPAEDKLLAGLAAQAGLVLRNVGLTDELLTRLDQLRESSKRLVTAQDRERRRIERDLHDGAQQHLIALKMRLGLARRVGERDPARAMTLLSDLEDLAGETLETLRDLARGIYPPLLADQGLLPALQAQARKAVLTVDVTGADLSRYSQEIEAAAYFCCLEALQNVAKYAQASRATIALDGHDGVLAFSVEDDGRGFDPAVTAKGTGARSMSDRLEALGGTLAIRSTPGRGTTVTGRIPTAAMPHG
jgi:signal transduction histidine kinase